MVRTRAEIEKRNEQNQRAQVRAKKTANGKGKPVGRAAFLTKLFRKSTKEARAARYANVNLLAVGGAPYWPPLTRKVLDLLKKKNGFVEKGFIFETVEHSRRRIVFKTQIKATNSVFGKASNYFEIDLGQKTIRFAPELKKLGNPNLTQDERLYLLGQRRI